ncbi:MAG TPA: 4-(cytidine 5'-diphospho)-2-C-methyl-D-erythritol kinase [Ferruginibacter sp.]|jgi:4-diphosphocytidyl-2-C-methyl-D-erythritol kinase|nr:4-(cytidine 5'-diphospho)-2-C-methyl-D-erythritol kinase [Ferruginibacter sp.]
MLLFPNCKINLGLNILSKREDSFHDIATVFYPVPITDAIEIISAHSHSQTISFTSSGIQIDGNTEDNSCIKAYHLLKKKFPLLPAVKIHLHKSIPLGAGLGGGSADGAFTLQLLNDAFKLNLSTEQLINYAVELGSDCPFFIINKPCFATGRGEILKEIKTNLSGYQILVVNPGIHINTGWAFSQITPILPNHSIEWIIEQPVAAWKENLVNDFEGPVFEKYPVIQTIKEKLYQNGAVYAAMSGSGSSVFGIFEKDKLPVIPFADSYFVKSASL